MTVGMENDNEEHSVPNALPVDIDPSSWALIQRLQSSDDSRTRQAVMYKCETVRVTLHSHDGDLVSTASVPDEPSLNEEDDCSSQALVQALIDEDHVFHRQRQARDEESRGLALALQLQQEQEVKAAAVKDREACKPVDESLDRSLTNPCKMAAPRLLIRSREDEKALLSDCQRGALQYVAKKAAKLHQKSRTALNKRFQKLGFSSTDVTSCLEFIQRDASIVIHVSEETLGYLTYDTHYRNLFELGPDAAVDRKNLLARKKWESGLFGGWYDKCEASLRPKYGCLNIFGDVQGVNCARGYGTIVLMLANHVRHRTTYLDRDSSINCTSTLATNEYHGHVLSQYSDDELKAVVNISSRNHIGGGDRCECNHYKEVQIHGPIRLATDIQALSVPGREADAGDVLRSLVNQFQGKTGCNVLWQGDLLG